MMGGPVQIDPKEKAAYEAAAAALQGLQTVDRAALAALIHKNPERARVLGLVVDLSNELLKNKLRHRLGTSSPEKLARTNPLGLITMLDEEFHLVDEVEAQRTKQFSFVDILLERAASRSRAARAIRRGRALEDAVEAVVKDLGLPSKPRTTFIGRDGLVGPCDLAIPTGGAGALIVVAIKAFDATGSKLTDARREIREMAQNRDAKQFAFAVVDGIGWLGRLSDLRKIHELLVKKSIHGLYSLARMPQFRADLKKAAQIHGLL
jgi:hypothetical protein